MTDLALMSLCELSRAVELRDASPLDSTMAYLERIERLDGQLHAFNELAREQALQEARKARDEIAAGRRIGALHGLCFGVKDLIDVAGLHTTAQSAWLRENVAARDAQVVTRLRQAGAIILGKTATAEFAIGGTQFDLPWPPARNPWNPALDPGNSSSGSGVAVAAGLCTGAIGTDTGGSIRLPAAWCGIAGLKPTFGVLGMQGVFPYSKSLDHIGPMGWTVQDCAVILDALMDSDMVGLAQSAALPSARPQGLRGVRIGVLRRLYEEDPQVEPDVRQAMTDSLDALRTLGASLQDVEIPYDALDAAAAIVSRAEGYARHRAVIDVHPDAFGATTRARHRAGEKIAAYQYLDALEQKERLLKELDGVFDRTDVIVLPTGRKPAQELGINAQRPGQSIFYCRAFNLTGNPALALCNGFSAQGLPLSLQVVGRRFDDGRVLGVGHVLEAALGLRERRPGIALI